MRHSRKGKNSARKYGNRAQPSYVTSAQLLAGNVRLQAVAEWLFADMR